MKSSASEPGLRRSGGIRDSREKGAGMRTQDYPPFQTLGL